jgi:hypothetical protein
MWRPVARIILGYLAPAVLKPDIGERETGDLVIE